MSLYLKLLVLSLVLLISIAEAITITQKGYYEVTCDGTYISKHSTYRKALEVAINKEGLCLIAPPDTEVFTEPTEPVQTIKQVTLTWTLPTLREDGTSLPEGEIGGFNIYYGPNRDNLEGSLKITGAISHANIDLDKGTWYFTISTVDSDGLEGPRADIIEVII